MSNIEPTEEQKQAAHAWLRAPIVDGACDDLARLLAEREAKLTEPYYERRIADALRARDEVGAINDTLRARVAELEATTNLAWVRMAAAESAASNYEEMLEEAQKREAQHLADIKATKDDAFHRHVACVGGCSVCDLNSGARCSQLARLAHYDDAKAAEGEAANE